MRVIGRIIEMDAPSGIGTVETQGSSAQTTIFAADCRAAGIEPRVGARLAYVVGNRPPNGPTAAIELEKLG
jgi:hypothetical protein